MKYRSILELAIILTLLTFIVSSANAGFQDMVKDAQKALGGTGSGGITQNEMIQGLKEALEIGTDNAVKVVSKPDGYYNNPEIKIPLPENVQKVEKLVRGAGYGAKVDAFELSMNRAAEQAAPEARAIFWDAIKTMEIEDAKKILNGADNEATLYFKDKTFKQLEEIFKPMVQESMGQVGVTSSFQDLNAKVEKIPFSDPLKFDLDQYVTDGALEGLFKMLAAEEKRIRQDPAARATDLLKKVFGNN